MPKHKLFNKCDGSPLLRTSEDLTMTSPRNLHPALSLNSTVRTGEDLTMTSPRNLHPALSLNSTVRTGVSKSKQVQSTSKEMTKTSEHETIVNASDSDSDGEVNLFFSSSAHIKLPYTREEDELILKYVLKGENIFKVSSILLWKHLESKKDNPKRTYQSLKNRFLRNIKPNLFSSFGHLIKNQTTIEKILKKFPELKYKMNKRETLSRIRLPERRANPQVDDEVSSTSAHESQESRLVTSGCEPNHVPSSQVNEPRHRSPLQLKLNSDWYKPEVCLRKVKINKDGMTVWVNFMSKKQLSTSTMGVFEKYKKLSENNKLILCSTCGRHNRPSISSKDTDVLIPNSQETPNTSLKNLGPLKSKKANPTKTRLNPRRSSTSPSLLSNPSENNKSAEVGAQGPSQMPQIMEPSIIPDSRKTLEKKPLETSNSDASEKTFVSRNTRSRALKASPVRPNTRANNSESRNRVPSTSIEKSNKAKGNAEETSDKRVEASSSSSNKNANSGVSKRPRGIDEHFDSIGEEAIANFRQLIDYEEEQMLVRRCLNKNFKSIGLEAVSQTNWDSYFLESSSDVETPPLTIDYVTDNENESATGTTASGASLPKNTTGKKRTWGDEDS